PGTEINEGKFAEINRQCREHRVEERRFCRLIRRVQDTQQSIVPGDGSTGRVDAVIPIVFNVSVAAPTLLGRGFSQKLPALSKYVNERCCCAMMSSLVLPPFAQGSLHRDLPVVFTVHRQIAAAVRRPALL